MLEVKYKWNAIKISILQQEFENFCKIWGLDAGYFWFNSFYFFTVISRFDTPSLCVFAINLSTVVLFVLDESFVLIPGVKAWHIHFACIILLNKLCDGKGRYLHK